MPSGFITVTRYGNTHRRGVMNTAITSPPGRGVDMKISICDVCYYKTNVIEDKVIRPSRFRIGRTSRRGGRVVDSVRIDVCREHKHFLDDCRTVTEARKKINWELYGIDEAGARTIMSKEA